MKKKSDVKKFFRLNIIKILIVLIILILSHVHYIGYFSVKGVGGDECVGCVTQDIWINNPIFWLPYYFIGGGIGDFNPINVHLYLLNEKPWIAFFMFPLIILYWYLLACLIYFIICKRKK